MGYMALFDHIQVFVFLVSWIQMKMGVRPNFNLVLKLELEYGQVQL